MQAKQLFLFVACIGVMIMVHITLLTDAHRLPIALLLTVDSQTRDYSVNLVATRRRHCDVWGIVTTIFDPTTAVLQFARGVPNSCLVVVGDRKTNHTSWLSNPLVPENVQYLDPTAQEALGFEIVEHVPWNHFGRKNIGFLYAVKEGARWIYDFDDDNTVKDSSVHIFGSLMRGSYHVTHINSDHFLFNPYPSFSPLMRNTDPHIVWPRGFPLNFIKDGKTSNSNENDAYSRNERVAIFQSLADQDPDVDAIYRMTKDISLIFTRPDTVLVVPRGTYAPWNAQATLVSKEAFFGLNLPVTVPGRVSDIWRSYVTGRLLWEAGYAVAFCSPFVTQYRNPHDYMVDFIDENDLYTKSLDLIRIIDAFDGSMYTELSTMYTSLIQVLVDHGFVQVQDYHLACAWVRDLKTVGYAWPALLRTPFPRFQINMTNIVDGRLPMYSEVIQNQTMHVPLKATVTFWTADLHDGTRIDVPSTLMSMGHHVLNMGHKKMQGPYPNVLRRMIQPTRPLSPVIEELTSHSSAISKTTTQAFFDYYQNDEDMLQTDAFICQFPVAFCELYMAFNRTIIMVASHRLFLGRCSTEESARLIRHTHKMLQRSEKRPPNFIYGSSQYDVEYIKYFTGIDAPLLSSHSFTYVANQSQYCAGVCHEGILVGPLQLTGSSHIAEMNAVAPGRWAFIAVKHLYPRFELQDISNHRAMVLLPYAVHSFGITEVYALGIPLFVPTVSFIVELNLLKDKNVNDAWYCGEGFVPPPQHALSQHPFSPENRSREAITYWAQFADFYQWPYISTFSSWNELVELLDKTNFIQVNSQMVQHNAVRDAQIRKTLETMTSQIGGGRQLPLNWDEADIMWDGQLF